MAEVERSTSAPLHTEFSFALPRGYVDEAGTVHREGVMRLATARDEILPQRDPRVRDNEAYLTVLLLSRVVSRLDRKSTRLNSSHDQISYAVFCLKKKYVTGRVCALALGEAV